MQSHREKQQEVIVIEQFQTSSPCSAAPGRRSQQGFQNCTSQFSSRSRFEKIMIDFFPSQGHNFRKSRLTFFLKVGVVTVIKCGLAHDQLTAVLEEARLQRRWS